MSSRNYKRSSSKDAGDENFVDFSELKYSTRWSKKHFCAFFTGLQKNTAWNALICVMVFFGIISVILNSNSRLIKVFDGVYNLIYAIHVLSILYNALFGWDYFRFNFRTTLGFVSDLVTFSHYLLEIFQRRFNKMVLYYIRLHRPFRYLWQLNDYHMKGSVLGTTLKYSYIFFVLRVTWAMIWMYLNMHENMKMENESIAAYFFQCVYLVNKMFMPIGPSVAPVNDMQRIVCLLIMITGSFVVTGAAVASMSLVISIYLRPEETFRSRYRLIIKKMNESIIRPSLRAKVETFYSMYWHKQRAVSATTLLPIFPPTLPAMVYTDIYFKATQKSGILRDLSYQFLTEVAKKMQTIHYIPGDAIIKRSSMKSSIIYIAYGDIEMLTAEDDSTALLRMIRGTILSPYAGCPSVGSGKSHVQIRAATFCTAHVLNVVDLWKTALKYGRISDQNAIILDSSDDHLRNVKKHYNVQRLHEFAQYKSSILHFKRNLMDLKESKDSAGEKVLSRTDYKLEIAGCYIMRNRADSSLVDESDAFCLRPTLPCILQPKSCLQTAWNTFITCLTLVVCATHPYILVYIKEVPVVFRFYDYSVSLIFVLDLAVHLSTGANVEDGVPITLAQTAPQQASSKWFVLDVIGVWPIFEFIGDGHFAGMNKLLRLPKVFRKLKALEDDCVYHSNVLRFISFSLLLLIACYLMAALQHTFMCFEFGYCYVSNYTHPPYWDKRDKRNSFDEIFFVFYWAVSLITFTTHVETWSSANWNTILFTLFVLEVCLVLHIFIEAVYSATIMVTSAMKDDYEACIEGVTNFLIRHDVDPVLRQRFITYLQLDWYTDKAYLMTHKESIFYDLPQHVYQNIIARQRIKYLLCIPFMKLLHTEDLTNIATNIRVFYTSPNEILLNTGDISYEMYVIKQGFCEILCPITKEVIGTLEARSTFGVFECLLRFPAYYTIRAATHVQLFSISRKYLLAAIKIPKIADAIEFVKQMPEYHHLQLRYDPFVVYHPPKPTPNMERFRLPRKHEQDDTFLNPFYKLGVLSVLRYIFPRFTIRPDGRYLVRSEWFRSCCALISAIVFPGYTYLVLQWPALYYVTWLLDLTAYFDVLQRMFVGYYNENGILIYHPISTAGRYIKGPFFIDILACLPLDTLESSWSEVLGDDDTYRIEPPKQFLMLNRLLQLYRTPGALHSLTGLLRGDLLLVIRATPLFLALLNLLTCVMVFSSVNIFFKTKDHAWYIYPHRDQGGSWINLFQKEVRFNMTETPFNLHLACFFWVVYETTTTGYNSFKPTNIEVMTVLVAGMLIGTLIATYYAVRIISMRANVNKSLAAYQQNMQDITVFMRTEQLDKHLQKEVLEYYSYNWDKMGGADYRSVLKLCNQITLRTDIIQHIFGSTFTKCPILNQCDVSLLRTIGRAVRSLHFLKNTVIIEEDDIISDIYFVDDGTVTVRDNNVDITLARGSMFGNLESSGTIRCPVSLTSSTRLHLLQINCSTFFGIIADFPIASKLLKEHRPNNENYISGTPEIESLKLKEGMKQASRRTWCYQFLKWRITLIQFYLISVSLMCIYIDVYNAGFQDNSLMLLVVLYLLDIGFLGKFLIEYMLAQNIESTFMAGSTRRYSKSECYVDILSCVPIEILAYLSTSERWILFSWLRLNRVLRITTVYNALWWHQERISVNLSMSIMCALTVWFSLLVHIATCIWYFLGTLEEMNQPKSSWFYNDEGEPWCHNEYVCSLYFVLTTFTQNGVGDILPKQQAEVIFVSLLQIVSTLMYIILLGEFCNLIQYQSFRSFNYYAQCLELQEFLENNRVSRNLVAIVKKYSLHLWQESRGVQLPHFLTQAPQNLKLKIMSATYLYHLTKNPAFKDCEPSFLRQLVGYLKLYTYNKGMYVVKEMEINDSMYFIHSGRVQESFEGSPTKLYHDEEYFGTIHGLYHHIPYKLSYRTRINSKVLTLHLKDWEGLLKHFPKSKEAIYGIASDDLDPDDDTGKKYEMSNEMENSLENIVQATSDDAGTSEPPVSSQQPIVDSMSTNQTNVKYHDSTTGEATEGIIDIPSNISDGKKTSSNASVNKKGNFSETLIDTNNSEPTESIQHINEENSALPLNNTQGLQSVEDYIEEQNRIKNQKKLKLKLSSTRHVNYDKRRDEQQQSGSHELKPITDSTVKEDNVKSSDSDMSSNKLEPTEYTTSSSSSSTSSNASTKSINKENK